MTTAPSLDACAIALQSETNAETGQTWVHLLPNGTFTGKDGRGPYIADDLTTIMEASRQAAGRRQMPIDYEHQIDFAVKNGRPAPAAGWITGLHARTDGIWGAVEWTNRASEHIAAREYRYLSPVFRHTLDGRITKVLRAALVNNPNLDQLTALASMETQMATSWSGDQIAQLLQLLGLPADGDVNAVMNAVRTLVTQQMAATSPDPSQFVPIGDFLRVTQELNRVHQGVEEQAARMHVEEQVRIGRLLPFMRDWGIDLCTKNKPAFDAFVTKAGGITQSLIGPSGKTSAAAPSLHSQVSELADTDAHVASLLGHSAEIFTKARK